MTLLTNRGNIKNKTITNSVIIDKRTDKVVKYWYKNNFPYYPTDKKFRESKFKEFLKVDDKKSLDFTNRLFKFHTAGLTLAWSYHPHAFEVRCNNNNSRIGLHR